MAEGRDKAHLERGFGLLQATAAGMANMVGVGPFITIPLILATMGGPQCMLGWLVALVIAICDGQIWSELSASLPGDGGTYIYLREAFRKYCGKLLAFLFIWQFFLSMPMEVASGNIGLVDYLSYIFPVLGNDWTLRLMAAGLALFTIWLHYRRIGSVGKIAVTLWVGMLIATAWTIIAGATHFSAAKAFSFPSGAFSFGFGFVMGLGSATRIAMYDYMGYYSACYVGEEVRNPGKVLPRAVMISVIAVALIYILINLSMIGVIDWHNVFTPEGKQIIASGNVHGVNLGDYLRDDYKRHMGSMLIEQVQGRPWAIVMTLLIVFTAYGSIFALMLGYSRIPFAAARDGYFFKSVGAVHPTRHFPHVSLLLVGLVVAAASLLKLQFVIDACIVTRILIQFIMQAVALVVLRRDRPNLRRPFRMWLFPLPAIVSVLGFTYIFLTSGWGPIALTLGWMAVGVVAFLYWARQNKEWPFAPLPAEAPADELAEIVAEPEATA